MKHIRKCLLVGTCILIPWGVLLPNPIALKFISELQLNSQNSIGWTMELKELWAASYNLDGWYLTTTTDTTFIDSGLGREGSDRLVLRQDSLQSRLALPVSGATITLFDNSGGWVDELRYGDVEFSQIPAPADGQSLCLGHDWTDFWYFDNTPTFGFENDMEGAQGTIAGYVYNQDGQPLANVCVIHEYSPYYPDSLYVETDETGYFSFEKIARAISVRSCLNGYSVQDTNLQVLPDSLQQLDFYLNPLVGVDDKGLEIPEQLELRQNYPNPFNASTSIQFALPAAGHVNIDVLKLDGSLVERVVNERLSAGVHKVSWDAQLVPSGVYIYRIELGNIRMSRKMILLK